LISIYEAIRVSCLLVGDDLEYDEEGKEEFYEELIFSFSLSADLEEFFWIL